MTSTAIMMLIVAILTVWGGLALSMLNLSRHPEDEEVDVLPTTHAPEL